MSRSRLLVAIIGTVFAVGLAWMAFASPARAADLARGKKIYKLMCLKCHGKKGKGDGPKAKRLKKKPKDFSQQEFFDTHPDSELKKDIRDGEPPMPSFRKKLRDKDIDNVIAYIKKFADK